MFLYNVSRYDKWIGTFTSEEKANEAILLVCRQIIQYTLDKYIDYHTLLVESELKGEQFKAPSFPGMIEVFRCKDMTDRDRYYSLLSYIEHLKDYLELPHNELVLQFKIEEVETNQIFGYSLGQPQSILTMEDLDDELQNKINKLDKIQS